MIWKSNKLLIGALKNKAAHKIIAVWAADCAERVLPYFEEKYPKDNRPRKAIEACREWADTGVFKMAVVRGLALASHAAAREVGEDNAARFAARAAGQALATAHVCGHASAAAEYALKAAGTLKPKSGVNLVESERKWQITHLRKLLKKLNSQIKVT
ncbi:MAG: putative immunity protein [Nanoarchaeota archaeon]